MGSTAFVQLNAEFYERNRRLLGDREDRLRTADHAFARLEGDQLVQERKSLQRPVVTLSTPQVQAGNSEAGPLERRRDGVGVRVEAPIYLEQYLILAVSIEIAEAAPVGGALLEP